MELKFSVHCDFSDFITNDNNITLETTDKWRINDGVVAGVSILLPYRIHAGQL